MRQLILEPGLLLTVGVLLGLVAGYLFYRLWRVIVPRSWSRSFWRSVAGEINGMLTCEDPSDMLKHYKAFLVSIAGYIARSSMGLVLALIPVASVYVGLSFLDPSGREAKYLEVYPAIHLGGSGAANYFSRTVDGRLLIQRTDIGDAGIRIADKRLDQNMLAKKQAFCPSIVSCALYDLMWFQTHIVELENSPGGSVIVRPVLLDSNPFWPYLNDLDFWFFLAVMAGSTAAVLIGKSKNYIRL